MQPFTDISQESLVKEPSKGCYLSPCKIFICLVLVAAACTVVGVAVYFAHPDKKSSSDDDMTTTPPIATTPSPSDSPLLPTSILPVSYDLKLRPDIYRQDPGEFIFYGHVSIEVVVQEPSREITLHQRRLNIYDDSLSVIRSNGADARDLTISYVKKDLVKEFYIIVLEEELQKDDKLIISMDYDGPLKNDLAGIYWSSYTATGGETRYLVTSQLQSTDARKTFPCFDEPALKATFKVTLEYKNNNATYKTMSNMEIESTEELDDGWYSDHYGVSPIMSSYLLAFMVSDFDCKSNTTSNNKTVYVCARPNAIDQVDYALSVAGDMQEFFEEYHAIEYPLPKTVHVAVPDFSAGAMENWGLIIYRETALLYDGTISSAAFRQRVAAVISHELAHQWFGNLVTAQWWDDIWLNEGFASYMENLGVENQYTTTGGDKYWQMEAQFVVDALHDVFNADSQLSSHPVYQPVNHPNDINQIFDGITYDKGSSVIRMMNYFLTEPVFQLGLTNYLRENAYGVTSHTDLFNFLTQEAKDAGKDIDVSEVMNTWILQMGYPVITITQQGGDVVMEQKRFLFQQPQEGDEIKPSPYNYEWIVPITFIRESNKDANPDDLEIQWLRQKSDSVTATGTGWILGNVGSRFYYRVNYDEANWKLLYQQLVDEHTVFSEISRAQIITDSFSLGRAGEIDQTRALDAIEYMENEKEYIPWRALSYNIAYMKRMLQYDAASNGPLDTFMQSVVSDISADVGWAETGNVDMDHLQNRLRPLIHGLACGYASQDCLNNASTLFTNWKDNDQKPSSNLGSVVSCYGVAEGDTEDWNFALGKYEISNVASEKIEIMSGLGCSRNETTLQNYLDMLLTGGTFRDQDAGTVMASVSANPKNGKAIAWDFFTTNWENYIFPTFGSSTFRLASIISSLTARFSTQKELDGLETFIAGLTDKGTGENAFQQAVESVKANIAWRATNEVSIVDWLENKNTN